jgi:cell division septation protein DedD
MSNRDEDKQQRPPGDQDEPGNESLFSEFDGDDDFEDSDRDSDFATIYTEVDEDPELDDEASTWELEEEEPDEDDVILGGEAWEASDALEEEEPDLWNTSPDPAGAFDDEPPEPADGLSPATAGSAVLPNDADDDEEDWEEFDDEEEFEEDQPSELTISPAMIVVAVIALVLLGAGGYGVIEQRAGMQEEIRELQAMLATAAPPREVAAARQTAEQAAERNDRLEQQVEELTRENRSLQAIVSGLEKQLSAQQAAIEQAPPPPAPKPAAKPAPTPAPTSSAPAAAGSWFVNFSSYTQRSTAESWVNKLKPEKGRVIVATGDSNGSTIYRVRVVDLPDKASAQAIARALEQEYDLPKLWVGESG